MTVMYNNYCINCQSDAMVDIYGLCDRCRKDRASAARRNLLDKSVNNNSKPEPTNTRDNTPDRSGF